jgi:hypothetical protein
MESNHTLLQNGVTDRLSHQWLKHPFLYLVMVMLHRHLYVKQIRSYYANEVNKINNCYQDLNVAQNTYWRPPIGYDD